MSTARYALRVWSLLALALLHIALVRGESEPPPITSPRYGDVWTVGETRVVEWDITDVQVVSDNQTAFLVGRLSLGVLVDSMTGFWLWSGEPLAMGFNLSDRQVSVVVPDVPTGNNYILSLQETLGLSELFAIQNPNDPNGTEPVPSSISVTTLPLTTPSPSSSTSSSTSSVTATSSAASGTSSKTNSTSSATSSSSTTPVPTSKSSATPRAVTGLWMVLGGVFMTVFWTV
ncbi:hypothetical protein GY45DRAFT_1370896 [Cubamyces sp. BRFM 1775]|nr:hypothetical protein GY45DRAFT_1370896 [Cubamyces sp. BRFM 1775]